MAKPQRFDPSKAEVLDSPDRQRFLPDQTVLSLLPLRGQEVVIDVGAGTGRLTVALAQRLPAGRVIAVEASSEMARLLRQRVDGLENVEIFEGDVAELDLGGRLADGAVAVSVLHELAVGPALAALGRALREGAPLLVIDWERGRDREVGPPDGHHLYTAEEASKLLEEAGFAVERVEKALFPYHYALVGRPVGRPAS